MYFKCENFQKVGSFKVRGATNAVLQLEKSIDTVATHSSGNHGAALSWAATSRGKNCVVVVPRDASSFKKRAMERYGATLLECEPELTSREYTLTQFLDQNRAHFVAPYDDSDIIAGQGTAALEFLEHCPTLDQIWVPVGGGGLISGTILATGKEVEVIGAEPELADDAFQSLKKGILQPARPPKTIADGLRSSLGKQTFAILKRNNTPIALASERDIRDANRLIFEHMKIVVEPSSAVVLAAILANPQLVRGPIGIILSGGNVSYPQ